MPYLENMYYRKALRVAGFDPDGIKDAQKSDEFTLHIGPKELKGSEIGNPMNCAGAKACMKQQDAIFAWVGASMAILGFADGRLIRYQHNGQLPQKHDQGMFAVGNYKFTHVRTHNLMGMREKRRGTDTRYSHDSKGLHKSIAFHPEPSLATQMRRGWEVEAD